MHPPFAIDKFKEIELGPLLEIDPTKTGWASTLIQILKDQGHEYAASLLQTDVLSVPDRLRELISCLRNKDAQRLQVIFEGMFARNKQGDTQLPAFAPEIERLRAQMRAVSRGRTSAPIAPHTRKGKLSPPITSNWLETIADTIGLNGEDLTRSF